MPPSPLTRTPPGARRLASADPALAALIERIDPEVIAKRLEGRPSDPFAALARIVTGQQVSTAAARAIWSRLCEPYGGHPPAAAEVIAAGERQLREAGLSGRKAAYLLGLAEAALAGELDPVALAAASDERVIEMITGLRGLGRWSAEMFLIFHLRRPDVFSGGDLGLRRGIRIALGLPETPSPPEATEIAERWRPHRSLAALYLWEAARVELPE